jgi:signal transduction histidine kinase
MSEFKPTRILYMEDDPGLARLFQKNLERAGYIVDLARDGQEGLAMHSRGVYDVVAVDYKMPVHDGLEVIRRLAERRPLPPIIMLTGQGDESLAVEAMKLGAGDYIVKDVEGGYLKLLPSVIERLIRDVTERRKAQAVLQAAARLEATTTLAGGIAHQFNNLMFAIIGNAELLQLELADRPEATEGLVNISQAAVRASELAQQLLAFAHGGKYQPVNVDLKDIIQETLRLHERAFPTRIQVEHHWESDLWNIEADPSQMSQMLMSLCTNAVEAIQDRGLVKLITSNLVVGEGGAGTPPDLTPGRYVCLTVEDTGCGMSAEVQARMFEPFFSTKSLGRGLGLAAVYGIVKNHGGHLSIVSQQGQGTSVQIYLPATEVVAKKPPQPEIAIPTGSETILVIDDDEMVLSVTRQLLERLGYQTLMARNGKEAVDIARTYAGTINLALLDMSMPIMNGSEAYPRLMQARPEMKVILCSGYDLDTTAQALLNAGASAFLNKPCRLEVLASEIRKALDA